MKPEYEAWIKENVRENPLGDCRSAAHAMATMFPELRVVRGHYYCLSWGERGHWWCETPDGKIVDPTKAQFPSKGVGHYEEFTGDEAELPTGPCANCGEDCFNGETVCSESCHNQYVAYLQNPGFWV